MNFSKKDVVAHLRRNELDIAERLCREAIAADQRNGEAWHLRGLVAISMGAPDRAVQYFLRAIFHAPGDCAMHINLGIALSSLQRFEEAARAFQLAASLGRENFDAQMALAQHHFNRIELELADPPSIKATEIDPSSFLGWELQARIASHRGDHQRALAAALKALELNDALPLSHRIAADTIQRNYDYPRADAHYRKSIELNPDDPEARTNLATLLCRMARPAEAIEHYQHALKFIPGKLRTEHGLGEALLTLGRLDEGWPLYHSRAWAQLHQPITTIAKLERLPCAGERILFTTDQGPGEEIMFASLLPDLLRLGIQATVICNGRLATLFDRSFPSIRFIARGADTTVEADWHISLADTAKWLRRNFSDFPSHSGYLKADPDATTLLRADYSRTFRAKIVGISWSTIDKSKISVQKTIPLSRWGSILTMPNVRFVSLQYGACEAEIQDAERAFGIQIIRDRRIDPLGDLDSFASQVAAMDLVITTSNTTAHVAGGLGVPTWTFVPLGFGGLWHWFLEQDTSVWYPSVRLFRQKTRGDWQPAIDRVSGELADFVSSGRSSS